MNENTYAPSNGMSREFKTPRLVFYHGNAYYQTFRKVK
jgi:hypothetical protein